MSPGTRTRTHKHVVLLTLVTFPGLRQQPRALEKCWQYNGFGGRCEKWLSKPVVLGIDLRNRAAQGKDFLKV